MKAVEFIREYGWEEAKQVIEKAVRTYDCISDSLYICSDGHLSVIHPSYLLGSEVLVADLKQYIDARELVQSYGGMSVINHKDFRLSMIISKPNKAKELNKAITLVEEIEA